MSRQTRIALVGASGLIGMSLIRLAVERTDIRVIAIARREIPLPKGARMEVLVADPENWAIAQGVGSPNAANPYYLESKIRSSQKRWIRIGFGAGLVLVCLLFGGSCVCVVGLLCGNWFVGGVGWCECLVVF